MKDVLDFADEYYVLAKAVLVETDTRILKQGETFAIFDTSGDILPLAQGELGVYHMGTRHLAQMVFYIGEEDERPLLLNSTLRDDNGVLAVDMTNPDMQDPKAGFVPKGTLYIHREKFLLDGWCYEQISVYNYGTEDLNIPAMICFGGDYRDIFEIRGMQRKARGTPLPVEMRDGEVEMSYMGLDGLVRMTLFQYNCQPESVGSASVRFRISVPAQGTYRFYANFHFGFNGEKRPESRYDGAFNQIQFNHLTGKSHYSQVQSSNEQFNKWMERSTDDLVMMTTEAANSFLYPYAGIPWFCAAFGRDGIITALQCLWANPTIARGVLGFLARTQATEHVPEQDAAPGKIIHEVRYGEMANLNEIPFGRYYGSVDSTPLFLVLAAAYFERTGDLEFLKMLWPHLERALEWIEIWGDHDQDGFVEYHRETERGLAQQGWKDSHDSIFHADGTSARGPIALCEVQGYVYLAKKGMARLAMELGRDALSCRLNSEAESLKEKFDRAFWLEDLGTYALALDGEKRPCAVRTSNAGHVLFSGIARRDRAERVAQGLMAEDMFSGWGIRTVSSEASRYNPMSYHNGSIWPHDTSLVAWGLARVGHKDSVRQIFDGLLYGSTYMGLQRLPEVFCGFPRREGEAPTQYPLACSPQAWASGAVFLLLQSLLGLEIDARRNRISFMQPTMPTSMRILKITDLMVNDSVVDLVIKRYRTDVGVQISRRLGNVSVSVEK